jgi:hypothetical protein
MALTNLVRSFEFPAIDEDTISNVTSIREGWRVPVGGLDSGLEKDCDEFIGFRFLRKPRQKMTAGRRFSVEAGKEIVASLGFRCEDTEDLVRAALPVGDLP